MKTSRTRNFPGVADGPPGVIRLIGLTEAECRLVAAEGERLIALGRADRVTWAATTGNASISIWGRDGRHFIVHRRRGEVLLVGLNGRLLARSRRFGQVLNALRAHPSGEESYARS